MARDIDQVITGVREKLPNVEVDQWQKMHPADDDGMWFFSLPGVAGEIQLESSTGSCPFMVESDAMSRSEQATRASTVDDAVKSVTEYLGSLRS